MSTFGLLLDGVCQNSVESYLKSKEFLTHKQEAYQIHNDLIKGIISPEIQRMIEDSVVDKPNTNRFTVEEILNSDEFRFHSARIDTSVNVMVKPSLNTSVRFRDIYYLGNNQFKEFDLYIYLFWDLNERNIVRRSISLKTYTVPSRKVWDKRIWFDSGIYNGLEEKN